MMGLSLLLFVALSVAPGASPARAGAEDVAMFYDSLASYGNWVDYGNYGPVWYPTQGVTQNWRPYVDGRWVPTSDGWVFETGEPWGWATYHWGNWMPTTEYGWVWSPGSTWYPSTAAWRTSDDYVGWAPIPPPEYVPEPAYYPAGGYYGGEPLLDLLSAPFWIFAQAANFLLGFGQPYLPAYSYYNTGFLAPYGYVPYLFANTLFLSDFYYPLYAPSAFYCYGPSFPFVSRVTNVNITTINNFARTNNFTHIRNGLPSETVFNRHPFMRDAVPASVRESGRFQARAVANPATVGRRLANPGVMHPPANVPRLTHEIPRGVAPTAQPAARGAARGMAAPTGLAAPRGPSAPERGMPTPPRGVTTHGGEAITHGATTPRGEVAPGVAPHVRTPSVEHRAPVRETTTPRVPHITTPSEGRAPAGEFVSPGRERAIAPREFQAPTRAPSREFRAPTRGTTMPPPATHEITPRMQQQIRSFQAPSRPSTSFRAPSAPAPRMAPSAPAPHMAPSAPAPHMAPSAPAPHMAPSAPAPHAAPSAPAPAPHGGGGGSGGGQQHQPR